MTLEAIDSYRDLANRDHGPASAGSWALPWGSPDGLAARRELVDRHAHLVKVAMGRIGAQLSPYLDESVLMGRGLITLFELAQHHPVSSLRFEDAAAHRIVRDLRRLARSTEWFRAAWSRRIEPLCAAASRHATLDDHALAQELDLYPGDLQSRFTEAGLVFGVCPERMIPVAQVSSNQRARIASVIAELPAPQGTILAEYFEHRLSFPEIAELLALPRASVQALYGRAAVAIRAALTGPITGE